MDFVIIGNAWDAVRDNPTSKHQVALELARQGHRALWVSGAGMRTPSIGSRSDRSRVLTKIRNARAGISQVQDNIWHIAPLILPFPQSGTARWINARIYLLSIRRAMRRNGFRDAVLINFLPTIPGVIRGWQGVSVYYCVDRWDAFINYDTDVMRQLDKECSSSANLVVTSSAELYDRAIGLNSNTHLISHGVDHKHFEQALSAGPPDPSNPKSIAERGAGRDRPTDLPDGKIIGFFGLISEWVDQDLIVRIANEVGNLKPRLEDEDEDEDEGRLQCAHILTHSHTHTQSAPLTPDTRHPTPASVVLIGKVDVAVSRLGKEKNIFILGPKPFQELPSYLAHFSIGLIPFVVNDLTKAVNPIKLREMLAAGVPVVSTALPEVENYRKSIGPRDNRTTGPRDQLTTALGVAIGHSHEEFVALVKAKLEQPLTLDERKALSDRVKGETWEAKVKELIGLIKVSGFGCQVSGKNGSG